MQDHDLMNFFLEMDIRNEQRYQLAKAENWSFWTMPMSADQWNREYGYFTYAEYEDHQTLATWSDLYKDLFGVRPRYQVTPAQAEAQMDSWLRDEAAMADFVEDEPVDLGPPPPNNVFAVLLANEPIAWRTDPNAFSGLS